MRHWRKAFFISKKGGVIKLSLSFPFVYLDFVSAWLHRLRVSRKPIPWEVLHLHLSNENIERHRFHAENFLRYLLLGFSQVHMRETVGVNSDET